MANCLRVVHYRHTFVELTENWIYNQIRAISGVSSTVYCAARKNRDIFPIDEIRCVREDIGRLALSLNLAWWKCFHRYPQLLRWLRRDRPDILHAHFGSCGYHVLPYARRLGIPLVTSFYGHDAYSLPQQDRRWYKRYAGLFERGRVFLAEGPAMGRRLVELGCPADKVIVHPIGINVSRYEFRPREWTGTVRVLFCGRFVEKKGLPYAIKAFAVARTKARVPMHLTVVGDSDATGSLTSEKKKVLGLLGRYGLHDMVTLTGYLPHTEVLKLTCEHDIYLSPSVHASTGDAEGGFPVILTEVAAAGMPIVAFDHCDVSEIVLDGRSGFVVPERDVTGLAEKLQYLVEHPQIWPAMGRAGRAHVEANHDIEKLNDRLVTIYQQVLSS